MKNYSGGLVLNRKTLKVNHEMLTLYKVEDFIFGRHEDDKYIVPVIGKYKGRKNNFIYHRQLYG